MTPPPRDLHPLSYGQRALWFLQKLAPGSAAYNVPFAGRIRAAVDGEALRRGFQALADRHPALRTTYPLLPEGEGSPLQWVHERLEIDFAEIDAAAWNEEELHREVAAEAHRPIALERPPVVRLRLFRHKHDDCVLLLVLHHIAVDFLSLSLILTDLQELLAAAFAGRPPELPPPTGSYAGFARRQEAMLQGAEGERSWEYWRNELAGELPQLALPTDRPRPRVQSFRGGVVGFDLEEAACAGLSRLVRLDETAGASLFTVVVAAFKALLHRVSGQDEIVVGSTLPGRPGPELRDVVGYFVNTVLLRGDLAGDPTFRRLLAREARVVSGALAHQHLPFPLLVERLAPERDLGRSPLYQVLLAFYEGGAEEQVLRLLTGEGDHIRLGPLDLEPFAIDRDTSMLDLTLNVMALPGRMGFSLQYDADLFDLATAERLARGLQALLEQVALDPDAPDARLSQLSLGSPSERGQLTAEAPGRPAPPPRQPAPEQAARDDVDDAGDLQGIAIVGLAVRFPGAADAEQFWENLCAGVEAITFFEREELRAAGTDPALLDHPNFVRAAGRLDGIELFDAGFFNYNAREASVIDPQQRIFLECAWEALEDAACDPETCEGPIGVYAGVSASTYLYHLLARRQAGDSVDLLLDLVGNDKDFIATRTSYKLGLTGPSFSVQSACSTSLVATHLACQSLLNGECDVALAGGSSIATPQERGYLYSPAGIMSPDGHCRAFDARARGTVGGSGTGVVVLKRLEDALADGDRIRAVIRGSAVNNDGTHKAGFTAPSAEGQGRVIAEALAVAGVPAQSISYVEAHGSGTPLGDTIEVAALSRVFAAVTAPRSCALGSVKTNLGHLDAAAGVAGLVKTALALQHRTLPASLNFEEPSPRLHLDEGPFYVNTQSRPWPAGSGPRRAGVSAFGLGGTNAHLVLEEPPAAEAPAASRPWQLLLLSARTPGALEAATDRLSAHLAAHPEQDFADVAYTAKLGRRAFKHRRMLVCRDRADACRALAGRDPGRLLSGAEEMAGRPVAFAFPGLGEHYPEMGRGLYEQEPGFRKRIDRCAELLLPLLGTDLRELLYPARSARHRGTPAAGGVDLKAMLGRGGERTGEDNSEGFLDNRLDQTAFAHPALFAVEYALAGLWQDWGIVPQAVVGYSLGEYVAACVAGVFSLEDALFLVARRARMIEELPAGAMLAVPLAAEALGGLLGPDLSIAAVNGPQVSVVAGPIAAVAELESRLAAQGLGCRRLRTRHAFHCGLMEPIAERFTRLVAEVPRRAPSIPCLSNVTGTWLRPEEATDPGYWARHLLGTVRFADNLAELWNEPGRILLEVGPGQSLASLALQHPASTAAGSAGPLALHSLAAAYERQDDQEVLLAALGRLWLAGVRVDWRRFYAGERRLHAALPTYPFERQRYWFDGLAQAPIPQTTSAPEALSPAPAPQNTTSVHARPNLANVYVAPETGLERGIARLWQELLGVEQVGVHDSFFALGGHSLLATQVISRLVDSLGVELSLEQIFEAPTIAELAAVIAAADGFTDAAPPPPRQPIPRRPDPERAPLSFAQQRLWFIDQLAPGNPLYNVAVALRIEGPLDVRVLTLCLGEIVRRHETLRTVFAVQEGSPVQVIRPAAPFALPVVDVSALPDSGREALTQTLTGEEAGRPFDLAGAPQLRATLLRLAEGDHVVALTLHHIVCDSWSITILVREVTALYAAYAEGRPSPLPELPVQYADYAVWQSSWLHGATLETEVAFWREQLAGLPPLLTLPTDRPRPAVLSFRGATRPVRLPAGLTRQAEALGRREGATLFMVLLAALQALLARQSGQPDVAVGAPVAGRNRVEIEGLIGFFINTLVLRGDMTGAAGEPSFRELLRRARETALTAYKHQDVPFEKLVQELTPERRLDHTPLFQVMLTLQNAPADDLELADLRLRMLTRVTTTAKFDLTLNIGEQDGELAGEIEYSTDLFDAPTIDRLMGHFERLLASALAEPGARLPELELLSAAERQQLLREWNDTAVPRRDGVLLQDLFAAMAARAPHAPAVVSADRTLTYGELDRITGRLAGRLRGLGVGPDVAVGVLMERSAEMVVALLGILKAGGCYLPLDPEYPGERLAGMAAEARVPVLLAQERLLAVLPPAEVRVLLLEAGWDGSAADGDGAALPGISDASLAYLLYTSGSTGRPKGVMIPHRGIVNRLLWMQEAYGLTPDDRVLQKTPFGFDVSVWEFFWPLITGSCLVVASPGGHRDAAYLAGLIARERVTVTHFVPSMLQAFLDQPDLPACPSLRLVIASGEALSAELRRRFQERLPARLENLYGPTEASVDVTAWSCAGVAREGVVPIGRPVANTGIHLLDRAFRPIPVGVAGELCIGGVQLARGYWQRPELTAERFVPDSCGGAAGGRLYRTGDLARHLPDGSIEFLGRLDHQVKIRGFRIELGEIEAALESHPGVRQAVVSQRADQLIAHFVPASAATGAAELRAHLRRSLPEYMVPAALVSLPELPLTVNGKVDRRALPDAPRERDAAVLLLPRSPVEDAIAGIWAEILQVDRVGVHDNFFDVGGHSLRIVEVQAGIRRALGREVPIVELFRHPTVAALAAFLGGAPREAPRQAGGLRAAGTEMGTDIAIIALEGRFPGAPDVDRFWDNLRDGVESIARLTDGQLLAAGVDPGDLERPDLVRAEALLEGIDLFDATFFGFNPREAQALDPQQRVFLEHAWACLESAGYDPARYAGRIGVFAGAGIGTYALNVLSDQEMCEALDPLSIRTGIDKDFLATRVAYKLGLRGPAVAIQTACSTSLVAVHFARQSLLAGECDMAMAGGVTLNVRQGTGYRYVQGGIGSPDGHCRAFDAAAQGTVPGSGVGLVLLKRLDDALRDGDTIHAVLKGSAINNDGALKVGFTAPSVEGQAAAISAAFEAAGVSPDSIGYVEAHGTATPLGDPIEVAALTQAFRRGTGRTGFCSLGSVKTNFGHLDAAAGVAGLIKATLALRHRQIPPSLHFESPNPALDLAASPFRVAVRLADWQADGAPRRAGVSSFGIGGTNAHAVLEEAPPAEPSGDSRPFQLLLLSARTSGALEEATARLALWLESHPEVPLADVAHTLRVGRQPFEHRRMLVCASREDALAALRGQDGERLLTRRRESAPPAMAWLLPGQGSQHPGMGRGLYESEPVFRRAIDACAELLAPRLGRDLREILVSSPGAELAETRFAQPALFAVEHALARLWLSWGLRPQALIGHSLGEYVAACLTGVLSLEDALTLVAARGELMQGLPTGAMLSVDLSADEARGEIVAAPGLSLAAVNGPGQCVVSGPVQEIDALAGRLAGRSVPCRRLHTSHAFHSEMMEPILGRFAEIVARVELRPPSMPYLSNLTGTWITAAEATDPRYWTRHLRETVRFGDGVSRLLAELPPGAVLLEVGPGQALGRLVRGQAAGRTVLASMPHPESPESGTAALLHAVGRLWLTGVEIDWQAFQGEERRHRVPLPSYPFQRQRFWVDAPRQRATQKPAASPAAVDPGRFVALGGGEPVRATADFSGLLRDPRNAELLQRLLAAEPNLRVLLPAPPEAGTAPEHGVSSDDGMITASAEPAAGSPRPDLPTPYREPQSELERRLAAIWGHLLGIDRVGVHDDFFELGGHSLLATRLLSRVREDFECEMPMDTIFAAPTVARLAAHLEAHLTTGGEPAAPRSAPILPAPRGGDLPLSFAQQRLLFLAVMAPGDPSYNLPLGLRLDGRLDVGGLRCALDALVTRHEPLRTTFRIQESQVTQVIAPSAGLPLPLADLAGLPAELREAEGRRLAVEQARHPFDLQRSSVVVALLVRFAPTEHLLLLTMHHIASDGWSCAILYRDLTELYRAVAEGRRPLLPELPVQYADFAAWQRTGPQEEELERHLDYWRTHLAGARAPVLPTDRPRPLQLSGRGATVLTVLTAETVDAARRLARAEDATLFMVLLSAFAVILHRATGCDDLVIGTDIANRNRSETEDLIGLFVNQLALRGDLSGNPTFRELVRRIRQITLKAYAHQDAPFDRLVEALNPVRDLATTPLFQVKLVLQNAAMPVHQLTELKVSPLDVHNQTAKFELLLNLVESGDAVSGAIEYSTDLWDEASMARLFGDFATVLATGTTRPDERLSRIEEELSRSSPQPGEERRTILRRRAIPVSLE
jgi:amino acid adenylation domain-containing protein